MGRAGRCRDILGWEKAEGEMWALDTELALFTDAESCKGVVVSVMIK
jgi:hypothetical protein